MPIERDMLRFLLEFRTKEQVEILKHPQYSNLSADQKKDFLFGV